MQNPLSRRVKTRQGFPVLPGGFPVLGHIPMMYRGLAEAFERSRAIGKLFWIEVGFGNWGLVARGPEALEILKSKAFDGSHLSKIAPLVAGESVLSKDGAAHRHMRSALSGPFSPRGLSATAAGRMSSALFRELAERWAKEGRARLLPEVQTVTLDVLFRMLGVPVADVEPWRRRYRDLLLANLNIKLRFPGSPAVRSERARAWIDEQLVGIVAEARRAGDQETLLGALAHARDDEERPLTDRELIDNLRLLLLGGHETISATLAWTALELARDPRSWGALVAEATRGDHIPESPEEARRYPFAEAVFRETVRAHPAFGTMTRTCVAPFEIHGQTIPEGTLVIVDLWGISHDEGVFPEPMAFRPERWLGRTSPPSALEISQFGAGPHFCLGYHLAWLEGVQFAVALGRAMAGAGRAPSLRSPSALAPIYLPTEHPSPKVWVDFR